MLSCSKICIPKTQFHAYSKHLTISHPPSNNLYTFTIDHWNFYALYSAHLFCIFANGLKSLKTPLHVNIMEIADCMVLEINMG